MADCFQIVISGVDLKQAKISIRRFYKSFIELVPGAAFQTFHSWKRKQSSLFSSFT
jgi:hypothetical protein